MCSLVPFAGSQHILGGEEKEKKKKWKGKDTRKRKTGIRTEKAEQLHLAGKGSAPP